MAEETTTKVYDVSIQASEALKTLAQLKIQSQELQAQQKALGTVTEQNAEQYFKLDSQIKATNKEASTYQKQITSSIKLQNQQEASLAKLQTQLSLDNAELVKMGNSLQEAGRKKELQDRIIATTAEIKSQEQVLGNYRRSVGDYEQANVSLRTELRALTEQLTQLAVAGKQNSEEYSTLAKRAGELRDAQADVRGQIQSLGSDNRTFETIGQAVEGVVAAYGAWSSISSTLGINNEELDTVMKKMVVTMGALKSLTTINNILQKESNVYMLASNLLQKVGISQTLAQTKALAAKNIMINAGTLAEKGAAAATWLWNAALAANPVVLIATAIAALITGVVALTGGFKKNVSAQKEFERVGKDVEDQIKRINDALNNELNSIDLNTRQLLLSAKQRGASVKELSDIEIKGRKDSAQATTPSTA